MFDQGRFPSVGILQSENYLKTARSREWQDRVRYGRFWVIELSGEGREPENFVVGTGQAKQAVGIK